MNTVSITRRVNKKYYPVVFNQNGSIKPNVVKVNGVETYLAGGNFYISWTENGKVVRRSVGAEAGVARNRRDKKEKELAAIAVAAKQGLSIAPAAPAVRSLSSVANEWLQEIAAHKDYKSYQAYKVSMGYFLDSCIKESVEAVTRQDMLDFIAYLRDKGLADRTVSNKYVAIVGFLKQYGAKLDMRSHDSPKYVQEVVEVYEQEELDALYTASTPDEAFLWRFALMTGMRDSELMHIRWQDFNEAKRIVTVRAHDGFVPKAGKERNIPVPALLMAEMVARKGKQTGLIFPAENGKPNDHMYRMLQKVAEKAGVQGAYLHKFRQTYGTRCHDAKVPTRTIMAWMGHSSMSATLRYLREATGEAEQALSNEVWVAS